MSLTESELGLAPAAGWQPIGWAGDVPLLEGRSVRVGARRIAVFRLNDGWAAIDHACPHLGGPLSDGIVAENCVTCPLHGRRYSLGSGALQSGEGDGVQVYEVRERGGWLELRVPVDDFA